MQRRKLDRLEREGRAGVRVTEEEVKRAAEEAGLR